MTRTEILTDVTYWAISYFRTVRGAIRSNQPCWTVDTTKQIKRDLRRARFALELIRTRSDLGLPLHYGKVCTRIIEFSEPFLVFLIKLNKEYLGKYETLGTFDWKSKDELKSWYKSQLTGYLNPNPRR